MENSVKNQECCNNAPEPKKKCGLFKKICKVAKTGLVVVGAGYVLNIIDDKCLDGKGKKAVVDMASGLFSGKKEVTPEEEKEIHEREEIRREEREEQPAVVVTTLEVAEENRPRNEYSRDNYSRNNRNWNNKNNNQKN